MDNTNPTVKLVILSQTSWGSSNIPQENWVNPKKKYTCNGFDVVDLCITLRNSLGKEVTFPVKGNIVISKRKRKFMSWTLDGKFKAGTTTKQDLKLKEE